MAKVLVTEGHLNNIAEAIREKNGDATTYPPGDMAAAIQALDTSGIHPTGTVAITANGTTDVTNYASANVNVQPNLQSKTVTQNGTVMPDSGYDGLSNVVVNVSGGGNIIKIEMNVCQQDCYLYCGGNRGWAVYPNTSGAQNSETFYADIPQAYQNGGMIILSTERPSGASYEFTRNRIGFTDGTEDPGDLPDGQNIGNTTQPSFYMNAMSQDKSKQFSMVRVPSEIGRASCRERV